MVELNELCLHHVFEYLTPIEWVAISEVCQLWKEVVKRQWRKITVVDFLKAEEEFFSMEVGFGFREKKEPVARGKDAMKILLRVAPYLKTVRATGKHTQRGRYIVFGSYRYKAEFFHVEKALKILAENATEITELVFDRTPKIKLLQALFETNKVKKIKFKKCSQFYCHVPTDSIEELDVRFNQTDYKFPSYEGHFPNLQKLMIKGDFEYEFGAVPQGEANKVFPNILPFVPGIKTLVLNLNFFPEHEFSYKFFLAITNCSQLEELVLDFHNIKLNSVGRLFKALGENCPKFHSLAIDWSRMDEKLLLTVMSSFPNLERFRVITKGVGPMDEMPELKKMKVLNLEIKQNLASVTNLIAAVKKMPSLENLFVSADDYDHPLSDDEMFKFICDVIDVAASQKKDVFLTHLNFSPRCDSLSIQKKVKPDEGNQTLTFETTFNNRIVLYGRLTAFVQKRLAGYEAKLVKRGGQYLFGFLGDDEFKRERNQF